MTPKRCPKCDTQGACMDSRQVAEYVRRRYRCRNAECGCGWTTAEFFVEHSTGSNGFKIRNYIDRQEKDAMRRVLENVVGKLLEGLRG